MRSFKTFLSEDSHLLQKLSYPKDPKIGWWKDGGDHMDMYHGTHVSRLDHIARDGIRAPDHGPTAGKVSLTHDPHTAHGYASMTGGESAFRAAGAKAQTVPHDQRAVLHLRIPKSWAEKNMDHSMRGNVNDVKDNLSDKSKYDAHAAAGRPDHEHYAKTELRFNKHIPAEFIHGYSKRYG